MSDSRDQRLSGIRFYTLPIRPHIRTTPATRSAGELGLKIGQAHVICPSVAADGCPMAAVIVGAADHQAADPAGAHLGKGDFLTD